jgi:hypothetical protein
MKMYSHIYSQPSYSYGDPYYGSSYVQPSAGQQAYQTVFGGYGNDPYQGYDAPYEIIDESQLGQPIAFSESASTVQQPIVVNTGSASTSNSIDSLYRRNYVVSKKETDRIKDYFNSHTNVDAGEFKVLSSELAPQPNVENLAGDESHRFSDNNGKLNFDDFLVAYAFVRHNKFGGAPINLAAPYSYSYY